MAQSDPTPLAGECLSSENLTIDRDDLLAVLRLRFGTPPDGMRQKIEAIDNMERLGRLILAAANACDLASFQAELDDTGPAFRLVGEAFNPLGASLSNGRTAS